MKDPIIEDVRRARETHAKRFNYDADVICEDLRKPEKTAGHPTVSLSSRGAVRKKTS